ncbi:hypothetical protein [Marivita sp.]|uniref:hypothetical protein n=1 Tax=Marivita sp. TaxID=2003365 RepID=UPI003F72696C
MPNSISARIQLTGDVQSDDFPNWIARHAHKLGLADVTTRQVPSGLEVTAHGAEEMLQALALGASLGPESVLVETMTITTDACS